MVSYAQNAEDVVLRRVFAELQQGFYVDIGACVPVEDSVTFHFYEQGWTGVNVEPDPRYYGEIAEARARDVNLNAAVGAGEGTVTFYPTGTRGQGTLDPQVAAERTDIQPIQVRQISLGRVFAEHAPPGGVDFLKVDVEGWEAEVLASADWKQVRPRIVLVEAVDTEGRATHEAWEATLLSAAYRFGLFDGLNRFYCREEDAELLLPHLSAPANVLDNWRPAREVRAQDALQARAVATEDEYASARTALEAERASHAETLRVLAAEQSAHVHTRAMLAEVRDSTSWRITAPLRDASRLAKLMRRGAPS